MGLGGRKTRLTPGEAHELLANIIRTFPYEATEENTDIETSESKPGHLGHNISDIKVEIDRERLRQARYSFQLSLVMTIVSVVLSLVSFVLLLAGSSNTAWAFGASAGLSSIAFSMQRSRESNKRLDKLTNKVKRSRLEE